jgi:hypothetical protein
MDVLLDREMKLYIEDSKTNVCIPFSVGKKYQSLEFVYSYEPQLCGDEKLARRAIEKGLNAFVPEEYREQFGSWEKFSSSLYNLITLSVDCGEEYLGCAHRLANEGRLVISADFSSPGFFRHPVPAGDWRVVLNVHGIVSEEVRYHLQVQGHNREDF